MAVHSRTVVVDILKNLVAACEANGLKSLPFVNDARTLADGLTSVHAGDPIVEFVWEQRSEREWVSNPADGWEVRVTPSLGDNTWSYRVNNNGHCFIATREKAIEMAEDTARKRIAEAVAQARKTYEAFALDIGVVSAPSDEVSLSNLEAAAKAATAGPHHIYTHPRDDNNHEANAAFQEAASPQVVMDLISRVRAYSARSGVLVSSALIDAAHDAGIALNALLEKPDDASRRPHARYYLDKLNTAMAARPFVRPVPDKSDEAEGYRKARGEEWSKVYNALREYRLSNIRDHDGFEYPLVDLMTRDGVSISDGEMELVYMTDVLFEALGDRGLKNIVQRNAILEEAALIAEDNYPATGQRIADLIRERKGTSPQTNLAVKPIEWDRTPTRSECATVTGFYNVRKSGLVQINGPVWVAEHIAQGEREPIVLGNYHIRSLAEGRAQERHDEIVMGLLVPQSPVVDESPDQKSELPDEAVERLAELAEIHGDTIGAGLAKAELARRAGRKSSPEAKMESSTAFAEWLNSGPDIAKAAGIEVEIVAITSEGNMLKLTSAGFPENTPTEMNAAGGEHVG